MIFYFIVFVIIGFVVGLITSNKVEEKFVYTCYLLISVFWFFIWGPFAIFTFFELIIGDVIARKIVGKDNNTNKKSPALAKNDAPSCSISLTPKTSTRKVETSTRKAETSQERNFDYENYSNGHSEKVWEEIGLKVSPKYKTSTKKYYSFKEIDVSALSLKYPHLTKSQRKVKILGDALVKKVKSKKHASQILINQYSFKKSTAEYAVGYDGYHDW